MKPFVLCLVIGVASAVQAQRTELPEGASLELFLWSEGAKLWRKAGGGAPLELARGVLFDCVAHSSGRVAWFPPWKAYLADSRTCRALRRSECAAEAEKAFARAVELDKSLTEATARWAWATAGRGTSQPTLAALYNSSETPRDLKYLAAMFSGRIAWSAGDRADAQGWFRRAGEVEPAWVSSRLALASVSGERLEPLVGESRTPDLQSDPWYRFRCSILTPTVRTALYEWMRRVEVQVEVQKDRQ